MTIVRTYTKLNRKIRLLNRIIKNAENEAKAYHDAATYHQAIVDNIKKDFNLMEIK